MFKKRRGDQQIFASTRRLILAASSRCTRLNFGKQHLCKKHGQIVNRTHIDSCDLLMWKKNVRPSELTLSWRCSASKIWRPLWFVRSKNISRSSNTRSSNCSKARCSNLWQTYSRRQTRECWPLIDLTWPKWVERKENSGFSHRSPFKILNTKITHGWRDR